ncbi:CAF17-like 4Fe-4S cluster assembly/insertion protein YgfZ [Granulibacter bethesdensis]|uniref:CAF17-like 4Fe-4S cluster assembly/insertion protein YgfZ n=1 Tax=Granulibacter bethesdensis TaxID=364410 RepID=UPI0003F1D571|nr:folate-binding protein YgfZ [Granulibacter bethesdensis]AHJ65546.1 Aminomethyltransferase family protein [Granulibacter bethesdensis CGDNIH4]
MIQETVCSALLPHRAVLAVTGEDRVTFLQGLVSNDVTLTAPGQAIWAAMLTPQGKWIADFFIFSDGQRLLLDVEATQAAMLIQKLSRFRLRARVAISAESDLHVHAGWGSAPIPAGSVCVAPDPRLPEAGWRALTGAGILPEGDDAAYDTHRLSLGLPDGSADLEAEKTVLLEAGFDELNGISWTKGCYMGQELTARTRYRGLLKRRLVPVTGHAPLPPRETPLMQDGKEVGTMRSSRGKTGLAILRLEALHAPVQAGEQSLTPAPAPWMRLAQPDGT